MEGEWEQGRKGGHFHPLRGQQRYEGKMVRHRMIYRCSFSLAPSAYPDTILSSLHLTHLTGL